MEIFLNFDFTHLQSEAAWFVIIYSSVLFAMLIDFITGVRKASKAGLITTSRGFRKTAEKAMLYLLPMFCLTLIDAIATVILDYPYLTAAMAIFNIYIEIRSVWENTHTKELTEISLSCAKDLLELVKNNKEEIEKILNKN